MSREGFFCGLQYEISTNWQACLTEAMNCSYSFIVAPIVQSCSDGDGDGGLPWSDMALSPQDLATRVVGTLSPHLNVDSSSPLTRQKHEDCLRKELTYCKGLGLPAIMSNLHGKDSNNLARILLTHCKTASHKLSIWMEVPMVPPNSLGIEDWNETWLWWSTFHERLEWDRRVGVVLELSDKLLPEKVVKRWLGEPVKAVVIPTSLFYSNAMGFPVLHQAHQQIIISMIEQKARVIVRGARTHDPTVYMQFLHRMWLRKPQINDPVFSFANGFKDYLQLPLQPLSDNLDLNTYDIFEKDPVKYDQYQKAIVKALNHLNTKKKNGKKERNGADIVLDTGTVMESELGQCDILDNNNVQPVNVMVLGAGRGPLVRATFNAADLTNTPVKVVAVEKNPYALEMLMTQARGAWRERDVTVASGDMRCLNLSPKADIIVSELLGSWGDNELSPECLDGAAGLLKPGGISIPREYSSYVAPVSSPRLWASACGADQSQTKEMNLETLWVVYMHNKYDIGDTQRLFTFEHPAQGVTNEDGRGTTDGREQPFTDNRRSAVLKWDVDQDTVLHGFGGYFDCTLFGDETISIVPSTHSPGMISWFPVFLPIKTPLRVKQGEVITATIWRCVDSRKVWYEWIVQAGDRTTAFHNTDGRSTEMLLDCGS